MAPVPRGAVTLQKEKLTRQGAPRATWGAWPLACIRGPWGALAGQQGHGTISWSCFNPPSSKFPSSLWGQVLKEEPTL